MTFELRTAEDAERDRRGDPTWIRRQLEDLADHVANAHRPSKLRTADAIRAVAGGIEWRRGPVP